MTRFPLRFLALLATGSLLSASCEHALVEPAPRNIALSLALAAGGPAQAFDRADAVWVQVRAGNAVRLETTIPMQSGGADVPVSIDVPLNESAESFSITVELRLGNAPLFRATTTVELRAGPQQLRLTLEPVGHALVLPEQALLSAYGDTLRVNGAVVFATMDTVSLTPVTSWTTLDPEIVAIEGGQPVARSNGTTQLIGAVGSLQDTMTVRVLAEAATITIVPTDPILPLGATRQYTADVRDRRGNLLDVPVAWSSTNEAVLSIDANGVARGLSDGSAIVRASSGDATGSLSVQVRVVGAGVSTQPVTDIAANHATLHALVQPNGQETQVWFMVGTDPSLVEAETTPVVIVAASSETVPVSYEFTAWPATVHYVRAYARNGGGTTTGNVVTFITPSPEFSVQTGTGGRIRDRAAELTGTVSTDSYAAIAWFELSLDPDFREPEQTDEIAIPPNVADYPVMMVKDSLSDGIYYFRLVAVSSADIIIYGNISSFSMSSGGAPGQARARLVPHPVRMPSGWPAIERKRPH